MKRDKNIVNLFFSCVEQMLCNLDCQMNNSFNSEMSCPTNVVTNLQYALCTRNVNLAHNVSGRLHLSSQIV
jgi:hypothetical protein